MNYDKIHCDKHGAVDFGIACIHVCRAIDSGDDVGFFWFDGNKPDIGRPDAWCTACEQFMQAHPDASVDEVQAQCSFQFLCEHCWDEAKRRLYDKIGQQEHPEVSRLARLWRTLLGR